MTDQPDDKTPEAIKKHKVQLNHNMPGPIGSAVNKASAEALVVKDQERYGGDRAERQAERARQAIATGNDVDRGTRGRLSQEFGKNDRERGR